MKKLLTCLLLITLANGLSSATPSGYGLIKKVKCISTSDMSSYSLVTNQDDAEFSMHPLDILALRFN